MSTPPQAPSDDTLVSLNRSVTAAHLLSGTVHEVNNALQVISGTVEILSGRADLPPHVEQALERLRAQSHRAAVALSSVLMFTRSQREGQSPVNLREVAEHSIALRQFAVRRARLNIVLDADAGLPLLVLGNRGDLQQALLNLLINAEQALAHSGGSIHVGLAREQDTVILRVSDDGPGLSLESARAFEAFRSTKPAADAAGLGLWATRTLVERHGGTIDLEDRRTGASFVIRLRAHAPT